MGEGEIKSELGGVGVESAGTKKGLGKLSKGRQHRDPLEQRGGLDAEQ